MKLTQHYKSTIPQYKKKIEKKDIVSTFEYLKSLQKGKQVPEEGLFSSIHGVGFSKTVHLVVLKDVKKSTELARFDY